MACTRAASADRTPKSRIGAEQAFRLSGLSRACTEYFGRSLAYEGVGIWFGLIELSPSFPFPSPVSRAAESSRRPVGSLSRTTIHDKRPASSPSARPGYVTLFFTSDRHSKWRDFPCSPRPIMSPPPVCSVCSKDGHARTRTTRARCFALPWACAVLPSLNPWSTPLHHRRRLHVDVFAGYRVVPVPLGVLGRRSPSNLQATRDLVELGYAQAGQSAEGVDALLDYVGINSMWVRRALASSTLVRTSSVAVNASLPNISCCHSATRRTSGCSCCATGCTRPCRGQRPPSRCRASSCCHSGAQLTWPLYMCTSSWQASSPLLAGNELQDLVVHWSRRRVPIATGRPRAACVA